MVDETVAEDLFCRLKNRRCSFSSSSMYSCVMNTQISVTLSFLSARLYNKRRISAQTYYKRLTCVETGPHLRHVDHRTHRINCWSRNLRSFNLWSRLLLLRRRDRVATTTMHAYQTHNPTRSHEVSGHIK